MATHKKFQTSIELVCRENYIRVRDFIDCIRSSIGYAVRLRREINKLGYKLQQNSGTQFDADVVRTSIPIASSKLRGPPEPEVTAAL